MIPFYLFALLHAIQSPAQRALALQQASAFGIWTCPCLGNSNTLPPNSIWQMTGEDSFDEHIQLTANRPVVLLELSLSQYVDYITNKPYTALGDFIGIKINTWFNLSHGCAGYVFVIKAENPRQSVSVVPNVTAVYDPTEAGTCK